MAGAGAVCLLGLRIQAARLHMDRLHVAAEAGAVSAARLRAEGLVAVSARARAGWTWVERVSAAGAHVTDIAAFRSHFDALRRAVPGYGARPRSVQPALLAANAAPGASADLAAAAALPVVGELLSVVDRAGAQTLIQSGWYRRAWEGAASREVVTVAVDTPPALRTLLPARAAVSAAALLEASAPAGRQGYPRSWSEWAAGPSAYDGAAYRAVLEAAP